MCCTLPKFIIACFWIDRDETYRYEEQDSSQLWIWLILAAAVVVILMVVCYFRRRAWRIADRKWLQTMKSANQQSESSASVPAEHNKYISISPVHMSDPAEVIIKSGWNDNKNHNRIHKLYTSINLRIFIQCTVYIYHYDIYKYRMFIVSAQNYLPRTLTRSKMHEKIL